FVQQIIHEHRRIPKTTVSIGNKMFVLYRYSSKGQQAAFRAPEEWLISVIRITGTSSHQQPEIPVELYFLQRDYLIRATFQLLRQSQQAARRIRQIASETVQGQQR